MQFYTHLAKRARSLGTPISTNAFTRILRCILGSRFLTTRRGIFFFSLCPLFVCALQQTSAREDENLWALEVPFSDTFLSISPEKVIDACTKLLDSKKDISQEQIIAALHQRAWAFQILNKDSEACKDYDQLMKLVPRNPQVRWERVLARMSQMDCEAVIAEYKAIIKDDPTFAPAYGSLAQVFLHNHDIPRAIENANHALQLDSSNRSALVTRATTQVLQQDYEAGLADLNRLLEISPIPGFKDAEMYYLTRGTVLVYLGRVKEAISNFHMAKKLNPTNESVDYWLCLAYQASKSSHLAFQLAIELEKRNPKSRRPPGLMCSLFNKCERYEETIAKGAEATKDGRASALIRYEVGFAHYALGNYQSAIKNLDMARNIPGACLLKAYLLSTCPEKSIRNGKAARDELEMWKDIVPESDPFFKMILAAMYAECGDYEQAIDLLEKCLKCKSASAELMNECKLQLASYRLSNPFESKRPPKARVPLELGEGYIDYFSSRYEIKLDLFIKRP